MLIILYPKFTNYLMSVFSPTFLPYVLLFFFEAFFLYTYYYGWGNSIPWCILAWGSASTSWARRSCSSPMPGSRS